MQSRSVDNSAMADFLNLCFCAVGHKTMPRHAGEGLLRHSYGSGHFTQSKIEGCPK